jgi:hypothetical protein
MLQQPILAAIRAALCDRIDEAALVAQRLARPNVSMPSALLAAGLYLANEGLDEQPSAGEQYFAWGPRAYRRYLDQLSPEVRAAEMESGRRVIFEGRGRRPPLFDDRSIQAECLHRDAA